MQPRNICHPGLISEKLSTVRPACVKIRTSIDMYTLPFALCLTARSRPVLLLAPTGGEVEMSLSPVTEVDDEFEQAGKSAGPCVMVVFGATGDLTMRKLVPALYNLEKAHLLPQEFAVLGVAIDDLSLEDFRKKVTRFLQAEDHGSRGLGRISRQSLHYLRGDFGDPATYAKLTETLAAIDEQYGTGQNYLFYMATAPKFFCEIVQQLGAVWPVQTRERLTGGGWSSRSRSDKTSSLP